jgi:DNA-binding response OmpR family regulator
MLNGEDGCCRPRCAPGLRLSVALQGRLKFGPFELSSMERVLRHEGAVLPLGRRSLDFLIYLAERPGRDCSREGTHGSCVVGRRY